MKEKKRKFGREVDDSLNVKIHVCRINKYYMHIEFEKDGDIESDV